MVIKVERGMPTPEELAVVIALVQARAAAAAGAERQDPPALTAWASPARTVPGALPAPGPAAWRTSVWPR